jgi:hypothetical protein
MHATAITDTIWHSKPVSRRGSSRVTERDKLRLITDVVISFRRAAAVSK